MIGVQWYRDTDPNTLKPAWWLIREFRQLDNGQSIDSYSELVRRLQAGELADKHTQVVTELILDSQAEGTWPKWWQWIDITRARGDLSNKQWRRLLHQSYTFVLHTRDQVRQGAPIPMAIEVDGGQRAFSPLRNVTIRLHAMQVGSVKCVLLRPSVPTGPLMGAAIGEAIKIGLRVGEFVIEPEEGGRDKLAPGRHDAMLRVEVTAEYLNGDYSRPNPAVEMLRWQRVLTCQGHVVDKKSQLVILLDADVPVEVPSHAKIWARRLPEDNNDDVHCRISFSHIELPQNCAFTVWLKAGGRRWRCGEYLPRWLSTGDTQKIPWWNVLPSRGVLKGFDAKVVDVVMEPSSELAERTIGIHSIYGQPVVIKNVPIIWQTGSTH